MQEISIGTFAKRTGLAVSAVRYYDDIGLIYSNRTRVGQRHFERSQIRRASFILVAQRFGFSLSEIKDILSSLPNNRTPTTKDWETLAQQFKVVLDQQIADLQILKSKLTSCIGCGCLSLERCKLYNPDDEVAKGGSGPRLLGLSKKDPG
jgi:MerR family redox-sensitive transcriptional activator SoxR